MLIVLYNPIISGIEKIIIEASEQSNRIKVPKVE